MQIDMTRPNPARIIDYWMGGSHNFEIDRQLAEQIRGAVPLIVQMQLDQRTSLRNVVKYMIQEQGMRVIVDFGAGLPTCENTHLVAREIDPSVRVLYSDIDPLTVSYGHEILANVPNVLYVEGDAQDPLAILENPAAQKFLDGEKRVGILYMALAHLLPDEPVRRAAHALYEWAAPGSCWFFTHVPRDWETDPTMNTATNFYRNARIKPYFRSPSELLAILEPWKPVPGKTSFNCQWGRPDADPNPPGPIFSFETLVYHD